MGNPKENRHEIEPDWCITVENNKLRIGSSGLQAPTYHLSVVVGQFIHVGCHRITKEAWSLLKEQIDENKWTG